MKKALRILLALTLVFAMSVPAYAEHLSGADGWKVTLTADQKLETNFSNDEYQDPISGLQPGDDITLTITIENKYNDVTDWYITNEVLSSLEDSNDAAKGGAYSYKLSYEGPSRSVTLYDSTTVGGDDSEGLKDATNALEGGIYLDTLEAGQSGTVTLLIALDGETQGNDYIDTLADLKVNFMVEIAPEVIETTTPEETTEEETTPEETTPEETTTKDRTIIKTNDDTNMFPYFILMAVSGVVLLALGFYLVSRRRRSDDGEEA